MFRAYGLDLGREIMYYRAQISGAEPINCASSALLLEELGFTQLNRQLGILRFIQR